jgi:hypothetical protein
MIDIQEAEELLKKEQEQITARNMEMNRINQESGT